MGNRRTVVDAIMGEEFQRRAANRAWRREYNEPDDHLRICEKSDNGIGHYWLQVAGDVWQCKRCGWYTLLAYNYYDALSHRRQYGKVFVEKTVEIKKILEKEGYNGIQDGGRYIV